MGSLEAEKVGGIDVNIARKALMQSIKDVSSFSNYEGNDNNLNFKLPLFPIILMTALFKLFQHDDNVDLFNSELHSTFTTKVETLEFYKSQRKTLNVMKSEVKKMIDSDGHTNTEMNVLAFSTLCKGENWQVRQNDNFQRNEIN